MLFEIFFLRSNVHKHVRTHKHVRLKFLNEIRKSLNLRILYQY